MEIYMQMRFYQIAAFKDSLFQNPVIFPAENGFFSNQKCIWSLEMDVFSFIYFMYLFDSNSMDDFIQMLQRRGSFD